MIDTMRKLVIKLVNSATSMNMEMLNSLVLMNLTDSTVKIIKSCVIGQTTSALRHFTSRYCCLLDFEFVCYV